MVDHYGHQNWWEHDNKIADWVAMILIQQTTEQNANRALDNLAPYLSVDQLREMSLEALQTHIQPAGFYKQKSNYIKALMNWFHAHGRSLDKFDHYSTTELRKELLTIKGVGDETADAMLLYIFNRKVFIADQYAMRLFDRLGFGHFNKYAVMRAAFNHLVKDISLKQCKEWHAAIDVHGKAFRKNKQLDETWLITPTVATEE
ncbi:DNA-3-methyladenine glycosylase III [Streptohalobacillus salinus]|uniref:DNA-3-methyladenine glycosylase III n=1 Tax=Streptohalobacillus salinus TaxID=621096 RepID=A0A2V3WAG6_9BACI|nr:endonuclease III domain-containing protein [Streptohalobacillus salinus]PXW91060.1 DNA-3-methyladenine glycosylase III [Streptohalobacillus salinus]